MHVLLNIGEELYALMKLFDFLLQPEYDSVFGLRLPHKFSCLLLIARLQLIELMLHLVTLFSEAVFKGLYALQQGTVLALQLEYVHFKFLDLHRALSVHLRLFEGSKVVSLG